VTAGLDLNDKFGAIGATAMTRAANLDKIPQGGELNVFRVPREALTPDALVASGAPSAGTRREAPCISAILRWLWFVFCRFGAPPIETRDERPVRCTQITELFA